LGRVRNFTGDYEVNGTERLCLPMGSPLGRTGSIVGRECPRIFPGWNIEMNVKGGDNEENN